MKNRVDLVNRALKRLGKLRAGEAAASEDAQAVDDVIDPLLATLASRSVVYVDDPDNIADEVFEALASRLAWQCADDFGVPIESIPTCAPQVTEAELRRITYPAATSEPIPFLSF